MKVIFFISALLAVTLCSYSQQIYVYPGIGFLYTGLTNYGNESKPADDFKSPIPTIAEYFGFEIIYKPVKGRINHKLNVQRTVIGTSTQVSSFKKLGYHGMQYRMYRGIEQALLSYQIQFNKKNGYRILKNKSIKLFYSIGTGVGFNKSKGYYNEQFNKDKFYAEYEHLGTPGINFLGWDATYIRRGIGIFITPEFGFNFYNKKRKNIFTATAFYDIGLKQMIESQQHYFYGNTLEPDKYTERYQKLFSRGSVFGFKIGVPIKLLNK